MTASRKGAATGGQPVLRMPTAMPLIVVSRARSSAGSGVERQILG
jgi:hypothetical protein